MNRHRFRCFASRRSVAKFSSVISAAALGRFVSAVETQYGEGLLTMTAAASDSGSVGHRDGKMAKGNVHHRCRCLREPPSNHRRRRRCRRCCRARSSGTPPRRRPFPIMETQCSDEFFRCHCRRLRINSIRRLPTFLALKNEGPQDLLVFEQALHHLFGEQE